MGTSWLQRHLLVVCASAYALLLTVLHAWGRFPVPSAYDISRLAGSWVVSMEGRVINSPQTRWGKTRFMLEGHAEPLDAFRGRVVIYLDFPINDLEPGEKVRLRGWLSRPRPPSPRRSFDERG